MTGMLIRSVAIETTVTSYGCKTGNSPGGCVWFNCGLIARHAKRAKCAESKFASPQWSTRRITPARFMKSPKGGSDILFPLFRARGIVQLTDLQHAMVSSKP